MSKEDFIGFESAQCNDLIEHFHSKGYLDSIEVSTFKAFVERGINPFQKKPTLKILARGILNAGWSEHDICHSLVNQPLFERVFEEVKKEGY